MGLVMMIKILNLHEFYFLWYKWNVIINHGNSEDSDKEIDPLGDGNWFRICLLFSLSGQFDYQDLWMMEINWNLQLWSLRKLWSVNIPHSVFSFSPEFLQFVYSKSQHLVLEYFD